MPSFENKARVFTLICIVLMTTLWVYNNDYFFSSNLKMKTHYFLKTGVLDINNLIETLQKLEKKCLPILPAGIDRGRGLLTNLWHYCGHY